MEEPSIFFVLTAEPAIWGRPRGMPRKRRRKFDNLILKRNTWLRSFKKSMIGFMIKKKLLLGCFFLSIPFLGLFSIIAVEVGFFVAIITVGSILLFGGSLLVGLYLILTSGA